MFVFYRGKLVAVTGIRLNGSYLPEALADAGARKRVRKLGFIPRIC